MSSIGSDVLFYQFKTENALNETLSARSTDTIDPLLEMMNGSNESDNIEFSRLTICRNYIRSICGLFSQLWNAYSKGLLSDQWIFDRYMYLTNVYNAVYKLSFYRSALTNAVTPEIDADRTDEQIKLIKRDMVPELFQVHLILKDNREGFLKYVSTSKKRLMDIDMII